MVPVRFTPKAGSVVNVHGFPERLAGDDLITELELKYSFGTTAIYKDIFAQEFEISDPTQQFWCIDIYD